MSYPSPFEIEQYKDVGKTLNVAFALIIFFILLILGGCAQTQDNVNFQISKGENSIKLDGEDLSFEYNGLVCGAQIKLKPSESGLIKKADVSITDEKISISKGLMSDLNCNYEVNCIDNICIVNDIKIDLDPEISQLPKTVPTDYTSNSKIEHTSRTHSITTIEIDDLPVYPYAFKDKNNGTTRGEIETLEGTNIFCGVIKDTGNEVDIEDCDYDFKSKELKLTVGKGTEVLDSDIDVRILKTNTTFDITKDTDLDTKTETVQQPKISFSKDIDKNVLTLDFNENDVLHIGENSTEVTITANTTTDLFVDTYITEAFPDTSYGTLDNWYVSLITTARDKYYGYLYVNVSYFVNAASNITNSTLIVSPAYSGGFGDLSDTTIWNLDINQSNPVTWNTCGSGGCTNILGSVVGYWNDTVNDPDYSNITMDFIPWRVQEWLNDTNNKGAFFQLDNPTAVENNHGLGSVWSSDQSTGAPARLVIESDEPPVPVDPTVLFNSTSDESLNYTNETLSCNFGCDVALTTWYSLIFKDGVEQYTLDGSCGVDDGVFAEITSENTTKNELWSCGVVLEVAAGNNTGGYIYSSNLTVLDYPPDLNDLNFTSDSRENLTDDNLTRGNMPTFDLDGDSTTLIDDWRFEGVSWALMNSLMTRLNTTNLKDYTNNGINIWHSTGFDTINQNGSYFTGNPDRIFVDGPTTLGGGDFSACVAHELDKFPTDVNDYDPLISTRGSGNPGGTVNSFSIDRLWNGTDFEFYSLIYNIDGTLQGQIGSDLPLELQQDLGPAVWCFTYETDQSFTQYINGDFINNFSVSKGINEFEGFMQGFTLHGTNHWADNLTMNYTAVWNNKSLTQNEIRTFSDNLLSRLHSDATNVYDNITDNVTINDGEQDGNSLEYSMQIIPGETYVVSHSLSTSSGALIALDSDNITANFDTAVNESGRDNFTINDWRINGVSDAYFNIPCAANENLTLAKGYSTSGIGGNMIGGVINSTGCIFDGSGDRVDLEYIDTLTKNFTFLTTINPSIAAGTRGTIFGSEDNGLRFQMEKNGVEISIIRTGVFLFTTNTATLTVGETFDIAYVNNEGDHAVYINCVNQTYTANVNFNFTTASTDKQTLGRRNSGSQEFNGTISNTRAYPRIFSDDELTSYCSNSNVLHSDATSLGDNVTHVLFTNNGINDGENSSKSILVNNTEPKVITSTLMGWENETVQYSVFNETTAYPIEKFNITALVTDLEGDIFTDYTLYFRNTAGGINDQCTDFPTASIGNKGNKQDEDGGLNCNEWLTVQEDRTTDTINSGVTVGDGVEFTNLTINQTSRTMQFMIDELYKPLMKDYPFNSSTNKFDNASGFRITKNNYRRWKIDTLPSDASFYQVDLRMQVVGGPTNPLELHLCNETYVSGDPDLNANCAVLNSLTIADVKEDGTKYRTQFGNDTIDALGGNITKGFIILKTEEPNTNRYYGLTYWDKLPGDLDNHTSTSIDSGTTWTLSNTKSDSININYMYPDTTCFEYFIGPEDQYANVGNSSVQSRCWRDFNVDDPPSEPILTNPVNSTIFSGLNNITWEESADPEGDEFFYTIELQNEDGTFNSTIATNIIKGDVSYPWDTTLVSDGSYNMTIVATQNETTPGLNSTKFIMGESFNVTNTPTIPILNAPSNLTTYDYPNGNIIFNWTNSSVPGANGNLITYIIEIDNNIDFSSLDFLNSSINEIGTPTIVTVPQLSAGTYYWRVNANEGRDNSSWSEIRAFTINVGNVSITILEDGLDSERKYEFETIANITMDASIGVSYCLGIDSNNIGTNYTCGTTPLNISFKIEPFSNHNISDNDTFSLTFGSNPQNASFNLSRGFYDSLSFNITGNNANNLQCALNPIATNYSMDLSLPGQLNNNILYINKFTNDLNNETILFLDEGSVIRNLNLTNKVNSLLFETNLTINLTGSPSNPENVSYLERFHNTSEIDIIKSDVSNQFVYEDFTEGDRIGNWGGTYTVYTDSNIQDSQTASSTSCGSSSTGTNSFYSERLAIEDHGSTLVGVTLSATSCVQCSTGPSYECGGNNVGSGTAGFRIKDKTTGVTTLIKSISSSSSCFSGIGGSDSDGFADASEWEIRRTNDLLEFYDDGVFVSSLSIDLTHQYEVSTTNVATTTNGLTAGNACGTNIGAQGIGTGSISYINLTGIAGKMSGNLSFADATVRSNQIANFSSNISTARLIATEKLCDGCNITYSLSADNFTFESIQNGITHVFGTSGNVIYYEANVSGLNTTDSGDLSSMAVITDILIEVTQGYPSNISINVGNDDDLEFTYEYELNETSSVLANVSASEFSEYIAANCGSGVDCAVPISISSNTSGGLVWNLLNFTSIVNDFRFNYFADNLTALSVNGTKFDLQCNLDGTGTVNFKDYNSVYRGDGNFTITAAPNVVNSNYTEMILLRNLIARFSPVNRSYPEGINRLIFKANNYTQLNITPFGQEINYCNNDNLSLGYCDNNSVGIFNISNGAFTDATKIYMRLNASLDSCFSLRVEDNVTTANSIIANITKQSLISSLPLDSYNKVFFYLNLNGCSPSFNSTPIVPIFDSYCEDCVIPTDYTLL